jgi:spermidine synthase
MKAWKTLGRAPGLDGQELILQERDSVFVIRSGGRELMSSARHQSEEEMTNVLKTLAAREPVVLIGGLGLGYTARAALDRLPPKATVVVSEISTAVFEWNKTLLGHLAGTPLADPRLGVELEDVATVIEKGRGRFDAILLDVDNGPSALSTVKNQQLYEERAIAQIRRALKPNGVLVVWSAGPDDAFVRRLGRGGFDAKAERSLARVGSTSAHVLFVARLRKT